MNGKEVGDFAPWGNEKRGRGKLRRRAKPIKGEKPKNNLRPKRKVVPGVGVTRKGLCRQSTFKKRDCFVQGGNKLKN